MGSIKVFNGGINTKVDPYLVPANEALQCTNCDISRGNIYPFIFPDPLGNFLLGDVYWDKQTYKKDARTQTRVGNRHVLANGYIYFVDDYSSTIDKGVRKVKEGGTSPAIPLGITQPVIEDTEGSTIVTAEDTVDVPLPDGITITTEEDTNNPTSESDLYYTIAIVRENAVSSDGNFYNQVSHILYRGEITKPANHMVRITIDFSKIGHYPIVVMKGKVTLDPTKRSIEDVQVIGTYGINQVSSIAQADIVQQETEKVFFDTIPSSYAQTRLQLIGTQYARQPIANTGYLYVTRYNRDAEIESPPAILQVNVPFLSSYIQKIRLRDDYDIDGTTHIRFYYQPFIAEDVVQNTNKEQEIEGVRAFLVGEVPVNADKTNTTHRYEVIIIPLTSH